MDNLWPSSYILPMAFKDLKYAQKARLEHLDALFFWEGRANRKDLVDRFGISGAQAALDFKTYLERSGPTAPVYDPISKRYTATETFQPIGESPGLPDWLAQPRGARSVIYDEVPLLQRPVALGAIARLYRAIRDGTSIEIVYQSMTTGEAQRQWIAPQRFGSDGRRLHVRAWSFKHCEYRDFVPARIIPERSFTGERVEFGLPCDDDWFTLAKITLAPHKRLTPSQKAAVRVEFGFDGPTMTVTLRKALEFYIARRWGLDQDKPRLEIEKTEYESLPEEGDV